MRRQNESLVCVAGHVRRNCDRSTASSARGVSRPWLDAAALAGDVVRCSSLAQGLARPNTPRSSHDSQPDESMTRPPPAATSSPAPAWASARLALGGLLARRRPAVRRPGVDPLNPLAPRPPHFPAKAKRVIHLFMNGGPSHVDTFDPKPLLDEVRRQAAAAAGNLRTERKTGAALAVAVQVPEVRPERHRGQRAVRARRPSASTTSASSARCTPTCRTTSRR